MSEETVMTTAESRAWERLHALAKEVSARKKVNKMMSVSATEAKNRLGTFLREVSRGGDEVIIESYGKPKAVLLSYEVYRELRQIEDQYRRREAMEALWRLREEVRSRNQDLTVEEADAIAEEISREAIANLIAGARRHRTER